MVRRGHHFHERGPNRGAYESGSTKQNPAVKPYINTLLSRVCPPRSLLGLTPLAHSIDASRATGRGGLNRGFRNSSLLMQTMSEVLASKLPPDFPPTHNR